MSSFLVNHTPNRLHSSRRHLVVSTDPSNDKDLKKVQLVNEFVTQVQQSVIDQVFISLTLTGTTTSKTKNNNDKTSQRGSIRQVQGRLIQVKKNNQSLVLQLTFKYYGATDICKNIIPEDIPQQLAQLILEPLPSEWGADATQPLVGGQLKTTRAIWELKSLHRQQAQLQQKKNTISMNQEFLQPSSHDRIKQVPLSHTPEFLPALGVTKPDGSPRPGMSSKLRQCNKFVEIVSGLIHKTTQPPPKKIRVVDMGCGRGYLTFALHSYLCEQYPDHVTSVGIDVRPKLVAEISGIAQSLGGDFDTLSFQTGTIEEIVAGTTSIFGQDEESEKCLNILIALHACDTATDDALWSGISQGADIIVVAPCCHKQVRPQLNAHITSSQESHPLYDVLRHGVYRERMSETVTDSLRALFLEQAGYQVQVFEFIGGEHTSKNVMITAIKDNNEDALVLIDKNVETSRRIQELAACHGITQQKLAEWMGQTLGSAATISKGSKWTTTQMPPKSGS